MPHDPLVNAAGPRPAIQSLVVAGNSPSNPGELLAQRLGLHQHISKTQQIKDLKSRERRGELGGPKLGSVKPFLYCEGLIFSVFLEKLGDVVHRRPHLFLGNDFHNLNRAIP